MKESMYSILEDQDVLINEKIYDEQNNLVISIDYSLRPKEEKRFHYNNKNQLIREESMIDDRVGDTQEFEYDEEGKINEQRHSIGGALYEKTVVEKVGAVETRKTLQDGEETERVEMEVDGDVKTYRFYDYGELVQVNTVKKEGNTVTTTSLVVASDQMFTEVQQFNDNGDLIESSDFYGEEAENSKLKREYEGGNCTKVIFESFTQPHTNYEEVNTFDELGNRIGFEKMDYTGRLMRFEKTRYNEDNKQVEKAGNSGSAKYHFRIDYDKSINA